MSNVKLNPTTKKWEPVRPPSMTDSRKFLTAEQSAIITEQREKVLLPVNAKAQDTDITKWFDVNKSTKQVTFNKEDKYDVIKDSTGKITAIKAKPTTYTSKYDREKGEKSRRQTSSYIPHEIHFDKSGNIIKEIYRDDYK